MPRDSKILVNEEFMPRDSKILVNEKYKDIFIYILGRYFNCWNKINITEVGLYSLTNMSESEVIFKAVSSEIKNVGHKVSTFVFIDGCAGMGFDTFVISYYTEVLSNELDTLHAKCIKQNIKILSSQAKENEFAFILHKIRYSNFDISKFASINKEIAGHYSNNKIALYLDPPFGGKDYSKKDKITLNIGEYKLGEFVKASFNNITNLLLIVLKLPFNYNLTEFDNIGSSKKILNLIKLNIMIIWK